MHETRTIMLNHRTEIKVTANNAQIRKSFNFLPYLCFSFVRV